MSSVQASEALERIKKTQENIAVVIGTIFTLTLCVYFFTYAMLVDKGLYGLLWAQGLSALAMFLSLIYLKHISFFLTRLWLGRRSDLRDTFAGLNVSDL